MRISSLGYCISQGFKNIWRHKMYSMASIATMAACIFMFGIFFCLVENVNYIVKIAESGVAITAFFDEGMKESEILEIGERIESRSEVSEMVYVSAEEAWEEYKEVYFSENPQLAEGFADDNPLENSAHFEIYVSDVELQDELVTYIESIDGVRKINQSEDIAKILSNFNVLVGYASVAIIGLLLAVSIFLISNTITIGINSRREEIGIMKLIGATNTFVRTPFLIEGIVIGLIGAILPMVTLFFGYRELVTYVMGEFNLLTGVLQFLPAENLFVTLIPVALLLSVGIGFLGSFFTTRKHLRI
ncbi:MAG: permease-like cell division protein FtsX [Lachnospiraceae bacterium]|nr:permease-like cell division protein FtsX [Lachnospiraceae bacterium]